MSELILIRHAPADHQGRLAGRRDVAAIRPERAVLHAARARIGAVDAVVASPALRCRMTAGWLFPDAAPHLDPRLWEQDFGAWEGLLFDQIPDHGAMSRRDLARLAPPGGESFASLYARVRPALEAATGRVAIVAHAGTVRAALSMALGQVGAGLAFSIDPLSVTRLIRAGDTWAVVSVNHR
ncbi:MAG: histidine phosphatase family protein [Paracoccus sp. (in: a-proteobacteria)]|nr:histidine phosphatase family protein [Paracoccus sp. (in: a-proteobacteria)]